MKGNYGEVKLNEYASLFDPETLNVLGLAPPVRNIFPLTFEQLGIDYGIDIESPFV